MIERTLVLLKPDSIKRCLAGNIINRFEQKGFKICGIKMLRFDEALSARHYEEHIKKEFYPRLLKFITSGPSIAMVIEGEDAINIVRIMMGQTKHTDALPGTIRGDLSLSGTENLVHGSDSPERAAKEISIFFKPEELF